MSNPRVLCLPIVIVMVASSMLGFATIVSVSGDVAPLPEGKAGDASIARSSSTATPLPTPDGPITDPSGGTLTFYGSFAYENVVTDAEAGRDWLPKTPGPTLPPGRDIQAFTENDAAAVWVFFSWIQLVAGQDHLYVIRLIEQGDDIVRDIVWESEVDHDPNHCFYLLGLYLCADLWVWVPPPRFAGMVLVETVSPGPQRGAGYHVGKIARDTITNPIRYAEVEVLRKGWLWDDVLGRSSTSSTGFFSISVPNDGGCYYVKAWTRSYAAHVHEPYWDQDYLIVTETWCGLPDGAKDIGTRTPPSNENTAWLVLDTIIGGSIYLESVVYWKPAFVTASWKQGFGQKTGYLPFFDHIQLDSDDGQSPDVVLHEYGHHVMDYAYEQWMPPDSGGDHGWTDCVKLGKAWSEGWSDFFPIPVQIHSGRGSRFFDRYREPLTGRPSSIDLELTPSWAGTDCNEGAIAASLYDIYDYATDANDVYYGGFGEIWNVLRFQGRRHDNFHDYWHAWRDYFASSLYDIHYAKVDLYQNTIQYDEIPPGFIAMWIRTIPVNGWYSGVVAVCVRILDADAEDKPYLNVRLSYSTDNVHFVDAVYSDDAPEGERCLYWDTTGLPGVPYWYRATVSDRMASNVLTRGPVNVDGARPTVTITSPANGWWSPTANIVVAGTASDTTPGSGLTRVEVRCSPTDAWHLANGLAAWSYPCVLRVGANTIYARAFDRAGQESLWAAVTVYYGEAIPPGAPMWMEEDLRDGVYELMWADAQDPHGILCYELWEDSGSAWHVLATDIPDNHYVVGYSPPGPYGYMVRAKNGLGAWGAFSPESRFEVPWDIRITSNPGTSHPPAIAVDSEGNYHIAWSDDANLDGYTEIHYAERDADWNELVLDFQVASEPEHGFVDSVSPAIVVDYPFGVPHERIVVVWSASTSGDYAIYQRTCTMTTPLRCASKIAWSTITKVSTTAGDAKEPDVATDSMGTLFYVWRTVYRDYFGEVETIVYYREGGSPIEAFSTTGRFSTVNHMDRLMSPRLAVGRDTPHYTQIHVVFSQGPSWPKERGESFIYWIPCKGYGHSDYCSLSRLTILGRDIDAPRSVSVAADADDRVFVAWDQWSSTRFDISFRKSLDGGFTWSPEIVFGAPFNQINPDVAIGTMGEVYLMWTDDAYGQFEVVYTKSLDRGDTWSLPERLTDSAGPSRRPRMAIYADTGKVGYVWADDRDGNYEIYFAAKCI